MLALVEPAVDVEPLAAPQLSSIEEAPRGSEPFPSPQATVSHCSMSKSVPPGRSPAVLQPDARIRRESGTSMRTRAFGRENSKQNWAETDTRRA